MNVLPFEQLDQLLSKLSDVATGNTDAAYAAFASNSLSHPLKLPLDPFSSEYRAIYLDLYKKVSTKERYSTDNEMAHFDVEEAALRPFPFYSKSLKQAGQHYSLIGSLLTSMGEYLQEGSKILECGFGGGNTTLALAMLGHDVTAIDVNADYCEIVRKRAAMVKVDVELIHDDFFWVTRTDQKFDAVVFFESFHHCWEFDKLLPELHRVLKPGGHLFFGAEPIKDEFPVPWGVRLDGESLFMARAFGWMELGFRSDFFHELLFRSGWIGKNVARHFWVAERRKNPLVFRGDNPALRSQLGESCGDVIKSPPDNGTYYALFGPYLYLGRGHYEAELHFRDRSGIIPNLTIETCFGGGTKHAYSKSYSSIELEPVIKFAFEMPEPASDVEFRMCVGGGGSYSFSIEKLVVSSGDHR